MARPYNINQVCEVCFKEPATTLTHNRENGLWYLCCSKCLPDGYWIPFDRILEPFWYDHMMKKGWVDEATFTPRFRWVYNEMSKKTKKISTLPLDNNG